jgi:hypothetical protein
MKSKLTSAALAVTATIGIVAAVAAQQPALAGGAPDRVAAFKQSTQEGLARIRQYEWVETTIISLKGEEKARKQNRAFYGADGKLQKVPIAGAPPAKKEESGSGGRRRGGGRVKEQIVENKKEDIQEYMENAVKLIHSYVPPNAAQIQAAKDAGHVTVSPPANGRVHIEITQYVKPGDSLAVDLDAAANRLVGLAVKSYLDKPDEPITLAVEMKALPDGALYAAQTTLDAKEKNIRVVVQNSGHKPLAK